MRELRSILVPVDFSETSASALDAAVGLAKDAGARLHLMHAVPLQGFVGVYPAPLPTGFELDLRRAAQTRLGEWSEKVIAAEVHVTEHVERGPASEAICAKAEEIAADLIVMGTRGLTGLKHVLLGSVAERTVQRAACPVLTVKAAAEARPKGVGP